MPDIRINALATTAITPAADDFIELDGAANGSRKLNLAAYVAPIAATRAQSSYGQSDGITGGRGIVYPGSDRTLLASVPAFEFVAEVLLPATTVNENRGILTVGNTSVNATTGGFSFLVYGAHLFFNLGTSGGQWQAVNYALTNASLRKRFHVSIPCGTQNAPTVTDETGATVTFTQSIAPSGADTWLGSTLANRAFVVGTGWPAGEVPRVVQILGTLSTAEKTEYRTTGRLPAWVMAGGSGVGLVANSGFEVDTTGWASQSSGTIARTTADFNTGVACLEVVTASGGPGVRTDIGGQSTDKVFICRFWAKSASGNTSLSLSRSNGSNTQIFTLTGAWQQFTYVSNVGTLLPSVETNLIAFTLGGAGTFRLDDVQIWQAGALTVPAYQGVGTVRDLTARGATDANQGRLVGVTPILALAQCGSVIKIAAQAFGAGTWVQLLGGAVTGANKQRIVSITGNSSANTTIDVGTNGSTATIVSAQTTNGDFDIGTFLSRLLAAKSSVWVRFAAATNAHVTINTSDL
jgi:hypothetical protein